VASVNNTNREVTDRRALQIDSTQCQRLTLCFPLIPHNTGIPCANTGIKYRTNLSGIPVFGIGYPNQGSQFMSGLMKESFTIYYPIDYNLYDPMCNGLVE